MSTNDRAQKALAMAIDWAYQHRRTHAMSVFKRRAIDPYKARYKIKKQIKKRGGSSAKYRITKQPTSVKYNYLKSRPDRYKYRKN